MLEVASPHACHEHNGALEQGRAGGRICNGATESMEDNRCKGSEAVGKGCVKLDSLVSFPEPEGKKWPGRNAVCVNCRLPKHGPAQFDLEPNSWGLREITSAEIIMA